MNQPAEKKKPQGKNVVRRIPGKKGFKSVSPQHKHFIAPNVENKPH
jgi:hypothetical protein